MLGAKEFKVGNCVDGEFLVTSSMIKTTKTGKAYIDFDVRALDGTVFEGCKRWDCNVPPSGVIRLKGAVDEYNGKLQIKADHWEKGEKEANDFQAKCPWELESVHLADLWNDFISNISDPEMFAFAMENVTFWGNHHFPSMAKRETEDLYFEHPGAQSNHHAYRHGLLEHTVEVMEHARDIAITHNLSDHEIDLLIAGCALHDIGKMEEFELVDGVYQFSAVGKAYGWTSNAHLYIGSQMLTTDFLINKPDVSMEDFMILQNIVMSHHGQFGDTKPKFIVSMIAHMADNASAQVNRMKLNLFNSPDGEVKKDSTYNSYMAIK